MLSKKASAVLIVAILAIALVAGTFAFYRTSDKGTAEVEGGTILFDSPDELVIRCLSAHLTLRTNDFSGRVTITNAFPMAEFTGSAFEGFQYDLHRNGTTIWFEAPGGEAEYSLMTYGDSHFSFAVVGDSQGHNDILADALNETDGCDFVIHCGDLTPSGSNGEYASLQETLNESGIPVFTTPGNHDAKNSGLAGYESRFGPTDYFFDYGGVRFAFVDSSDLNVTPQQISWLEKAFAGASRKVVVTHAPCYDPIDGNHTLYPPSADRLQDFALKNGVTAVFSGHVHTYYRLRIDDTDFVITGGAGGSLSSGTYHWLRVNVTTTGLSYDKIDINRTAILPAALTLKGHGLTVNLTSDELKAMPLVEGDSTYQNQFGNIAGSGHYEGVNVSSLLALVGNMSEGEVLRVTATDGYYQDFGYGNVFPNSTWFALQGPMILALSFNGIEPPDWQDGPRIAMLPSDSLYSNSDCNSTSYPGQGFNAYPSAGARWVKNVSEIEVVS